MKEFDTRWVSVPVFATLCILMGSIDTYTAVLIVLASFRLTIKYKGQYEISPQRNR